MTRPPALLRAFAAALAAAAAPALALAQGAVPVQPAPAPPAAAAWPLGLIVLGVAVVFLAGWLVSRRGRGPHPRARGSA